MCETQWTMGGANNTLFLRRHHQSYCQQLTEGKDDVDECQALHGALVGEHDELDVREHEGLVLRG